MQTWSFCFVWHTALKVDGFAFLGTSLGTAQATAAESAGRPDGHLQTSNPINLPTTAQRQCATAARYHQVNYAFASARRLWQSFGQWVCSRQLGCDGAAEHPLSFSGNLSVVSIWLRAADMQLDAHNTGFQKTPKSVRYRTTKNSIRSASFLACCIPVAIHRWTAGISCCSSPMTSQAVGFSGQNTSVDGSRFCVRSDTSSPTAGLVPSARTAEL